MRLATYLTEHSFADAEFAAMISVTRQAVHRYKTGERIPDQATMNRIFEVTDGAVTPNDFFNIANTPSQPSETAA